MRVSARADGSDGNQSQPQKGAGFETYDHEPVVLALDDLLACLPALEDSRRSCVGARLVSYANEKNRCSVCPTNPGGRAGSPPCGTMTSQLSMTARTTGQTGATAYMRIWGGIKGRMLRMRRSSRSLLSARARRRASEISCPRRMEGRTAR